MDNARFLVVVRFRGLGGVLRSLAGSIPEAEEAVRSIYLGPIGEEGVREAVLEMEIEPNRLEQLVARLSGAPGVVETRVESFPAAVMKDTTYNLGEE